MKKAYWIATYKEINDIKKLKQYSEKVTPYLRIWRDSVVRVENIKH